MFQRSYAILLLQAPVFRPSSFIQKELNSNFNRNNSIVSWSSFLC